MASKFPELSEKFIQFIGKQKMFFVATAAENGRVNLSPKGMDSLRVNNPKEIIWLNYTGSGNETAAHLLKNSRMTIMFCAFDGPPTILRLYGRAKIYHKKDPEYLNLIGLFDPINGPRQIVVLNLDLVQKSCGYAVPLMQYTGERAILDTWYKKRGEEGIKTYWKEKNSLSIDGYETGIERGLDPE